MKVPVQITIGGKKIRIEYPDVIPGDTAEEGDLSGDTQVLVRRVRISKTQNKSPEDIISTLFHEILHVAIGLTGHSEVLKSGEEEALVYALENMLGGLFVFHPMAQIKYRDIEFPFED